MKYLLFFVILILAILGLSEFLHILKLLFILPKFKMHTQLYIGLQEDTALKQIAFAGEQLLWLGNKYAENVFAVGDGLTEEMLFECQRLSKKYGIEILCERKDKNGCNIVNN